MQGNQKLGKASKALFVVSLVLGIVMLILSALAIALAAFKNNGQADDSLELQPIDDAPSTPDAGQRTLIEATSSSRLTRKE